VAFASKPAQPPSGLILQIEGTPHFFATLYLQPVAP